MKVMKFGGSSLADAKRYLSVMNISQQTHASHGAAVVLSAPKGVTNALSLLCEESARGKDVGELYAKLEMTLLGIANELNDTLDNFNLDAVTTFIRQRLDVLNDQLKGIKLLGLAPAPVTASILSLGEYVSVTLFSHMLSAQGVANTIIDPVNYVIADGDYLDSIADLNQSRARFSDVVKDGTQLLVMPGFVAANPEGEKVTLGRNGSDYSAAILAACLDAESCEIWTDVDGVFNADPNQVDGAVLLDKLTYQEAMELSYFGAKVLHPKTIGPIAQFHIPCWIKNTLNPAAPGTLISAEPSTRWTSVKGISQLDNMAMFNVAGPGMKGMVGMASRVFEVLAQANISICLITQSSSEYSISFCIHEKDSGKALDVLEDAFALELSNHLLDPIEVRKSLAIVTLVGDGMRHQKGLAARFFSALAQARVNNVAIAQGSSERSISTVIELHKAKKAVKVVHQNFFSSLHTIDVFLIGCGTVGKALLEQIHKQQPSLLARNVRLNVYGIANSKKLLLRDASIALNNGWENALSESNESFSTQRLADFVADNALVNPVIVDCTSSDSVADQYLDMLENGFHVVTPNKKANTKSMAYYRQLQRVAQDTSRQYLYETTVGAGLPVIDNLQKLLSAGDQLERFEGILSGSLSFVFGELENGKTLSEATRIAREKGYTEPDPRDDLSGMDVARKLLIMAREADMPLELSDITIESVLPASFDAQGSVEEFLDNLASIDVEFDKRVQSAKLENKVLRYVGAIVNGQCKVSIQAVAQDHPLAAIKDGENALAIHSAYYQPIPYVIRGYGAGAMVTAAGVFADILRTMPWKQEIA
ncbi:bifunctional aspartate kinase/homoserine dehydrogenase I [Alteromonas oceanisediminis]|uniref:bifunctional aspartate kinase/homoserine dehydrogenase I n=1 Tax=Alteromonas oceanisediminis TaxID=2836180 RepID=UPI001BDA446F|nr:bifunctional aspartate kinase/homoserine dehydrogenase I [Alteromonas oceanisediminis]MBT0585481.1 bifunctional aspartate kinase/homoserine dehydrogenase I [Alteromonas oceanisediminis]